MKNKRISRALSLALLCALLLQPCVPALAAGEGGTIYIGSVEDLLAFAEQSRRRNGGRNVQPRNRVAAALERAAEARDRQKVHAAERQVAAQHHRLTLRPGVV